MKFIKIMNKFVVVKLKGDLLTPTHKNPLSLSEAIDEENKVNGYKMTLDEWFNVHVFPYLNSDELSTVPRMWL